MLHKSFPESFSTTVVTILYSLASVKAAIFVSQINRESRAHSRKGWERKVVSSDLIPIILDNARFHCLDWRAIWPLFTHPSSGCSQLLEVVYPISGQLTAKKMIRLNQSQHLVIFTPCSFAWGRWPWGHKWFEDTAAVPPTPSLPPQPHACRHRNVRPRALAWAGALGARAGMSLWLGTGGKLDYRSQSQKNLTAVSWV